MKLAGFNFNKISVEKNSDTFKDLKMNTNIDISEIDTVKTGLFKTKEEFLAVKFQYTVDYEPDLAKVLLQGTIILAVDSKLSKEVLKGWKKKKVPEDFRIAVFNVIVYVLNDLIRFLLTFPQFTYICPFLNIVVEITDNCFIRSES